MGGYGRLRGEWVKYVKRPNSYFSRISEPYGHSFNSSDKRNAIFINFSYI